MMTSLTVRMTCFQVKVIVFSRRVDYCRKQVMGVVANVGLAAVDRDIG